MIRQSVEKEYRGMIDAYEQAGGDKSVLQTGDVAKLVVHQNKVLARDEVEGFKIDTEETESGVNVRLTVAEGARIAHPVHLCFGLLPKEGRQEIVLKVEAKDNSELQAIAHCVFPSAVKVVHQMDADIVIGQNARFEYKETHYHGEDGGIEVIPKSKVLVKKGGVFQSTFALTQGMVGKLDYDSDVVCQEKAVAELTVKAYGKGSDDIKILERIHLNGVGARGIAKSRMVLGDKARAEVRGETYGNAPEARGHIDCMELINGKEAVATAIPIVSVTDDKAKVTHEAAIGSIDRKQVETLMARGLDEDDAVDVIVKGILR